MTELTRELQNDLADVLSFVTMTASPNQIEGWCAENETTDEKLNDSLKRLGALIGMDSGIL